MFNLRKLALRAVSSAVLLAALPFAFPGLSRAETVHFPGGGGTLLQAELTLPPPSAPAAPAIVALHGCAGPYPARDDAWAARLAAAGHVVLRPDSFASRGLGSQCRVRERVATADGLRRADALAAAQWLAAQPFTPPGGVVVMGWSDGATTTLALALHGTDKPAGLLRGFIAFYPGCRWAHPDPAGPPILLLIGASDDWTPAAPCRDLAARMGPRFHFVAEPDAYHDFDAPVPVRVQTGIPRSQNPDHTVHAGGNPAAREDALRRVTDFLASLPPAP